ncbi:MAG: HAMP domain-containing sensor histidine kinase, partial [Ignavibacteria bacterium]|nr:HAMP domain-containing sensor histidine kinase [Ignavibacteria bacterium]
TIVYLKETASIIESMSFERPFYQGIVEDITERKLTELANSEAHNNRIKTELLKTEFLATISHEIRTPLNVILNFTQMLRGEDATTIVNEKNEAIDIIFTEGERIKRTIDLILELSQLQSDTYEYAFTELDLLEDVLNPVFKIYEPKAAKKNLHFNVTRLLTNARVTVDKQSVIQIFTQLLDNAVKFTSSGRIDTSIYQNIIGQICVEVADSGKGIREEYIPHLFSLFSQEENSYSRTFEGIGVGLAIIKKHCSKNNIRVDVDSKNNVGTKFIITFIGNTPSEGEEIFY